jgi:demethylmenaquinone methyltransferase/2-methoxy-6-polyprenyl-1,4-benzoquinol methylase
VGIETSAGAPAATAADGVDRSGAAIRDMFAGVAPRYDLLNHLLSGALDVVWRRRAAAALGLGPGARVLDLCCGTGDQAAAIGRRGPAVAAADFCLPMLALARRKLGRAENRANRGPGRRAARRPGSRGPTPRPPAVLAADALALPFPEATFDGATVAFGLRNVADLDGALAGLGAALRPGGRLVVLEFALPANRALRALYLLYFRRVLPAIGRLLSPRGAAYRYLPASVVGFPQRRGFLERMAAAGFGDLSSRDLAAGVVCLYQGAKEESR